MKVREFIEKLQEFDPEMDVVTLDGEYLSFLTPDADLFTMWEVLKSGEHWSFNYSEPYIHPDNKDMIAVDRQVVMLSEGNYMM